MLQYGGVVNSPTLAMLGESGPEMVSPITGSSAIPGGDSMQSLSASPQSPVIKANESMQQNAGFKANEMAASLQRPSSSLPPIEMPNQASNTKPLPTSPQPTTNAGGEAGNSAFFQTLKRQMYSLPNWRTRLG